MFQMTRASHRIYISIIPIHTYTEYHTLLVCIKYLYLHQDDVLYTGTCDSRIKNINLDTTHKLNKFRNILTKISNN